MSRPTRKPWQPAIRVVDLDGRTPPHNLDVEAAVLSTILTSGAKTLDELASTLDVSHWYADANRRVHAAALELHRVGQPVDLQTVAERLQRETLHDAEGRETTSLIAIGGMSYLAKLIDTTPAIANVRAHAEIIVDLATKRRAIETCRLAAAEGHADTGPTLDWLDSVEQRIHDLASGRQTRGVVQAFDLMTDAMSRLGSPTWDAIPTGFRDLDDRLGGGMRGGEVIVIAGRPGMGKTSFAMDVAVNVASRAPVYNGADVISPRFGVLVFSLEMPKEQLADRMVCSDAHVDLVAYRTRRLSPDAHDKLAESAGRLSQLPLWVDDTPSIGVMELRAKARRKQREYDRAGQKIGAIVIDYVGLMSGEGESREQEIARITRALKQLAKELNVPVIALVQLNRAVETRSTKDKRPQLSDLRESGAIEQDADVVIFIYRPEYYVTDKDSAEAKKLAGYAEAIVAKQRNGPTGRVPVTFVDHCARFENRRRDAWRDSEDA
jgi:replicative DNA helicase